MTRDVHVDASVIVAILLREADGSDLARDLVESGARETSVVSAFEAVMAIRRVTGRSEGALEAVKGFLVQAGIRVAASDLELLDDLADVHGRFGKSSGHKAKLNLGDCFSYAFAKRGDLRLLYKGDDFAETDLA